LTSANFPSQAVFILTDLKKTTRAISRIKYTAGKEGHEKFFNGMTENFYSMNAVYFLVYIYERRLCF